MREKASGMPLGTLRGVSQVDFQSDWRTAICFVIALFAGGWQFGVFGLLGTVVATLTAWVLGASKDRLTAGLEGFNGTLIGVALVLYFDARWITVLLVIAGAIMGSVLTSALNSLLTPLNLPTFTAPFCAVTTVMLVGAPSYERIWHGRAYAAPPSAAHPGASVTFSDLWQGLFNGIGQVFFQGTWYVGLIFLIGLAFAGWMVAAAALVSSAVGIVVAILLGAHAADIGAGLYGYNAVLTGIALCGTFVRPTTLGLAYAVAGAVSATVLTASVANLFAPVGGHTLTWPFVVVTWIFLAAVPVLSGVRRVPT
ncbi:Urea transporter [Nonomuraea coxensis DSM 45129]|uniref:Urea transporter n=1 Tax=Nonomuraea coxensis DSM 45129 TaxID=1122611 RepID=A0ABX8TZJ0_9ACTN|nr:urea transporter [Nonomuraea coxensis]QYC40911.1 Urea transporter [Nonomuraea coxensis DSM 45129]